MPPKFPTKVYWPRDKAEPKTLMANNQAELDALTRIGWKLASS